MSRVCVLGEGEWGPDAPLRYGHHITGPEELGFNPEELEILKVENKMSYVRKELPV